MIEPNTGGRIIHCPWCDFAMTRHNLDPVINSINQISKSSKKKHAPEETAEPTVASKNWKESATENKNVSGSEVPGSFGLGDNGKGMSENSKNRKPYQIASNDAQVNPSNNTVSDAKTGEGTIKPSIWKSVADNHCAESAPNKFWSNNFEPFRPQEADGYAFGESPHFS